MQNKLSKLQKVSLLYIGVEANRTQSNYIKRRALTDGLVGILAIENSDKKKFFVSLTNSVRSLMNRGLLSKRATFIGLTKEGKENAREVREEIISLYGNINWDVVSEYYGS